MHARGMHVICPGTTVHDQSLARHDLKDSCTLPILCLQAFASHPGRNVGLGFGWGPGEVAG